VTIEQTLLQEIKESKRWFNLEKDESTYKRDLAKRIELTNWVLENMKNPNVQFLLTVTETLQNMTKPELTKSIGTITGRITISFGLNKVL
jgi:hypothetical protein